MLKGRYRSEDRLRCYQVKLYGQVRGKEERYCCCSVLSGFSNKTMISHLLTFSVHICQAFQVGHPPLPQSVELCVVNKKMCVPECFPSVCDEIAPSSTDSDYFVLSVFQFSAVCRRVLIFMSGRRCQHLNSLSLL